MDFFSLFLLRKSFYINFSIRFFFKLSIKKKYFLTIYYILLTIYYQIFIIYYIFFETYIPKKCQLFIKVYLEFLKILIQKIQKNIVSSKIK